MSLIGLGPAWRASLALALGPLPPAVGAVAVSIEGEPWRPLPGGDPVDVRHDVGVWREGDVELHDRRSGARSRLVGDRVLLSSPSGEAANGNRVVPFALAPPLLDAGVALLHGAALADGDRAVLVLGPTGAGKSTTAAAARSAGLTVLGDDIAAVHRAVGGWRVQGLARPVRMPPDLAPGAAAVADDVRGRVTPAGWATGGSARLVAIALVGHAAPGEPGWDLAAGAATAQPGSAEVARAIVASAFATVRPSSVGPTLTLAAGLAELPGWHLRLASDPATRLHRAGAALVRILA